MTTLRRYTNVTVGAVGEQIIKLIEIYYPQASQLYVTSAYRNESGSHHIGLTWNGSPTAAVDLGAYDDPAPNSLDQADMRDVARWLEENFGDLLAELIHTTPYADDNGFYRTYGKRSTFSKATQDAHLNHVHVAFSAVSIAEAFKRAQTRWGTGFPLPDSTPIPVNNWKTLHLIDIASYQDGIDLAGVQRAGFNAVNIKTGQGLWYEYNNAKKYADEAKRLGMEICTFHWIDNSGSGRAQADYAFRLIQRMGGPANWAHQCDCEDNATFEIWRDYCLRMQELTGRPVINYTGDWWWTARKWQGANITPYLWAAPNDGYLSGYPGDTSPHWRAGYGGWTDYAAIQYSVSPIPGVFSRNVSKTAIRDQKVWEALTGKSINPSPQPVPITPIDEDEDDMLAIKYDVPINVGDIYTDTIAPVGVGAVPWGQAWFNLSVNMFGKKAAFRITIYDANEKILWDSPKTTIGDKQVEYTELNSNRLFNFEISKGARSMSIERLACRVPEEDVLTLKDAEGNPKIKKMSVSIESMRRQG